VLLWYDDVSIVGEGNKVEDGPIMKRRKGNVTRRRGAKCQAKLDSSYYLFVCLFVLGDLFLCTTYFFFYLFLGLWI